MIKNRKFVIKRKKHIKEFLNKYIVPGVEYTISVGNCIYVICKDFKNQISILAPVGNVDSLCTQFVKIADKTKTAANEESLEDIIWSLRKAINKQIIGG